MNFSLIYVYYTFLIYFFNQVHFIKIKNNLLITQKKHIKNNTYVKLTSQYITYYYISMMFVTKFLGLIKFKYV